MKRKLADVLWEAANKRLDSGTGIFSADGEEGYSCNAALRVEFGEEHWGGIWAIDPLRKGSSTQPFMRELGCNPMNSAFEDFEPGPERQGARYLWLLLAMHVAEDEGIEIEVPDVAFKRARAVREAMERV